MRCRLVAHSLCVACAVTTAAAQTLVLVDDTDSQIVYAPAEAWGSGPSCSTCTQGVNASRVYGDSWHQALFSSSNPVTQTARFSFRGTAVYVYGIVSDAMGVPSGNTHQEFFVDNVHAGTFKHEPNTYNDIIYHVELFQMALPDGQHTLTIQNGVTSDVSSLIMLDYVAYTPSDDAAAPVGSFSSAMELTATRAFSSTSSTAMPATSTPFSVPQGSTSAQPGAPVTAFTDTPPPLTTAGPVTISISGGSALGTPSSTRRLHILLAAILPSLTLVPLGIYIFCWFLRGRHVSSRARLLPSQPSTPVVDSTTPSGAVIAAQGEPQVSEAGIHDDAITYSHAEIADTTPGEEICVVPRQTV